MSRLRPLGVALLVLGLGACRSAPVHYYTLAPPVAAAPAPATRRVPFLLDVLPVSVPAQWDQPSLLVRRGVGGVVMLDDERWASPLVDELRDALSFRLTRRLGTQDIAGLAVSDATAPVARVKVTVRRLDAWLDQRVQLQADWSLDFTQGPHSGAWACSGGFEAPASRGYAGLVQAQRQAVVALADRIVEELRAPGASKGAACVRVGVRGDGR